MKRTAPFGLGIVGTGNIARGYARDAATHPEIRLVAVTDLDLDRATAFAAEHGTRVEPTLEALLANDQEAILVTLTVYHPPLATDKVPIIATLRVHPPLPEVPRRSLEAGRHVYSEKPLAPNSTDAHA